MKVKIEPGALCGTVTAPPSKSLTHRKLICSALSGRPCRIENVMLSEDILATMDCLSALGAEISRSGNTVTVDGSGIFVQSRPVHMPCRASGSTLRFLLPVVLALGRPAVFDGEASLFCRPLGYYEDLCRNQGILWEKGADSLSVSGRLQAGTFEIPGERSSQFVTGMLFALPMLPGQSEIRLIPPVTSRPYIRMTQAVLRDFSSARSFWGMEAKRASRSRAEIRHRVLRDVYWAMSRASFSSGNRAVVKPSSTGASTLIFRVQRTCSSPAASASVGSLAHSR